MRILKRMKEARLFGSAALLIVLIAVAYMSTTREGGEGGEGSGGSEVCVLDPKPKPVVGLIADAPRPLAIAGVSRGTDFYNSLDDVRKRLDFDDEPTNRGEKRRLEGPSDESDVNKRIKMPLTDIAKQAAEVARARSMVRKPLEAESGREKKEKVIRELAALVQEDG